MKQHITAPKTGIAYTLHGDYYEHASNKVPGHPSEIFDFVDGSGSYYLPDLSLPAEEEIPIGVWGRGCPVDTSAAGRSADRGGSRDQRHKQFLKYHQRSVYNEFLINGKLQRYLAQIDRDA